VAKPKAPGPSPPPPPPPLVLNLNAEFKRDWKRQEKRGKDMAKAKAVIEALQHHRPLEARHRDHALSGPWRGWRDCHVEPDWVLIYKKESGELRLARLGTHSDLFGK
jgi:mRNA interferase YafQ